MTGTWEVKSGKSKDGSDYLYLSIQLTPTYEKRVFFDNAEREILRLFMNDNSKKEDSK